MKSCFLTFMFFVLFTYVYGADDQNSISSIHTRLGEAIQQSDWNGVLRLSEKLVKKDPYNLWSHYYHGLGLTNTGNLKAGEKALKKVIKKDKKHFWANYILFFNYDRQNHTKTKTQAKKVETLITAEVLKSNPADIRYFYSAFAGYYTRTEDRKNTKKVLKAGLKKLPKDPLLRSQYAFTFFRVDMKKWKKLARKTLALVSEKEQKAINTYTFPLKGGRLKFIKETTVPFHILACLMDTAMILSISIKKASTAVMKRKRRAT